MHRSTVGVLCTPSSGSGTLEEKFISSEVRISTLHIKAALKYIYFYKGHKALHPEIMDV